MNGYADLLAAGILRAMDQPLVLERGALRVEVKPDPLRIHIRRDGRRLIRALRVWVAEMEVRDRFIHFTEGVVAKEDLGQREYAMTVRRRRRESARSSWALSSRAAVARR